MKSAISSVMSLLDGFISRNSDFEMKRRIKLLVGISFVSVLYVFLYVTGGINNTAFVWYFTFPLIANYLLGSTRGVMATILMSIPVLAMLVTNPRHPLFAGYSITFQARFLGAYLVGGVLSF
jgi:uncharacterized membrane protein